MKKNIAILILTVIVLPWATWATSAVITNTTAIIYSEKMNMQMFKMIQEIHQVLIIKK